jgi:hypothetical protein
MTVLHPYNNIKDAILDWASSILGEDIIHIKDKNVTRYSYVITLKTAQNIYYLKHTPKAFCGEALLLSFIKNKIPHASIPQVIAQNETLDCYITLHCGDAHIRDYLCSASAPANILGQALSRYQQIQNDLSAHLEELFAFNIPDWRLNKLPTIYENFLQDKALLNTWELDVQQLISLKPRISKLCQKLNDYNIKDSINHADLNGNNVLIDSESGALSIIDWSEVHIGCPLLSQNCFLGILCNRADNALTAQDYTDLQNQYFTPYFKDANEFEVARPSLNAVTQIYYILEHYELARCSNYHFPHLAPKMQAVLSMFEDLATI